VAVHAGVLPERYADPRLIGRGGMGEIYLARDEELGRHVAVKVLDERFAEDPDIRRRFKREALTAARLSGEPHVVTIFDVGEWHRRPFIVMEHLPGGTLGERARSGRVPDDDVLAWLHQAATALDAAHAKGVVHRDVKPANLLFDGRDEIRVVDFGIARLTDDTLGMTAVGTVLGTAGYLSPEQARGEPATPASDRYALAVVAYELLTGGRPFERGSATAEAAAHIHEPVPPASRRGVGIPGAVDAVFGRALAKDPARRYATAGEFVEALARALAPVERAETRALPVQAPPPRRRAPAAFPALVGVLLAAALLGGAVLAALAARGGEDEPTTTQPAAAPPRTVTQEVTLPQTTVVQTVTQAPPSAEPPAEEESEPEGGLTLEEAAALNDEAFGLMGEGRYGDALPLLERATPALRGSYSNGFRYEAYAEYNLGKTLAELGRCDEALPHLERSENLQGAREPITNAKAQCGA
jgi:eukaryotic-like serine/threonine-protein kinase